MPITALSNAFTFSNYWNGLKNIIDKINNLVTVRLQTVVGIGNTINAETLGYTINLGTTETPVSVEISIADLATQTTYSKLKVIFQGNGFPVGVIPFYSSENFRVVAGAATCKLYGGSVNGGGTQCEIFTDAATGATIKNLSFAAGVFTFDIDKGAAAAFSPVSIGTAVSF